MCRRSFRERFAKLIGVATGPRFSAWQSPQIYTSGPSGSERFFTEWSDS
jgi:hypothetical protein